MRKRYLPVVEGLESLRLLSRILPSPHADGVEAPHVSSSATTTMTLHELSVSHKKVVHKPAVKHGHKTVVSTSTTTTPVTAPQAPIVTVPTPTAPVTTAPVTPVVPTPPSPSLNATVLSYAESKMGTQDGDGQCATLAVDAEAAAGAKSYSDLGPTGDNVDYVWGNLVATIGPNGSTAGVVPGDVIQFHDVTTSQTITLPNGGWETNTTTAMHHTAIVVAVNGNVITLLQQNVGTGPGALLVQLGSIDTTTMLAGSLLYVYSPVSA